MKSVLAIVVALMLTCSVLTASDVGDRFPDFSLKDLRNKSVGWSEFQGHVVIVNLWMTTCPPCRKEMPMLQELQNEYGSRGIMVVGISADYEMRTAAKFAGKLKIKYRLLLDPILMTSEEEQNKFGMLGLPTTFVVDKNGVIQKKIIGFADKGDIKQRLDSLLSAEN